MEVTTIFTDPRISYSTIEQIRAQTPSIINDPNPLDPMHAVQLTHSLSTIHSTPYCRSGHLAPLGHLNRPVPNLPV
jgi:hypothetical protein